MKKIIIVGGGIAGLTAGIYAQKSGFESEVYDKNDYAGGLCSGWTRSGHYIDNCIQWLTGTEKGTQLRRLWEETGALSKDTEFIHKDSFYSSEYDGKVATLWKDLDKTEKELSSLSPEDSEQIHIFIDAVKKAQCRKMPVDKPMDLMMPMEMIKLGQSMAGMKEVNKKFGNFSLKEYSNRFKSPVIRKLLTDFYTGYDVATSIIFAYATVSSGNGEIPVGGSVKMIERMVKTYNDLGGKLYLGYPVKKVNVDNNKATGIELQSGFCVEGDYVICATDTYESFYHLIGKEFMSEKWNLMYEERSGYYISSKFQIALSVDKELCPVEGTLFIDSDKIKIATSSIERICVVGYGYEKDFAPVGKTVLQLKIEQNEIDYNYWKFFSESTYKKKKAEYADIVLKQLLKRYPQLEGHYEILDIWTPRTYHTMCNAFKGAFMRFKERAGVKGMASNGKIEKVSNLYLASQWMQSPGGLPTAAAAGKFAIQHILRSEGKYTSI